MADRSRINMLLVVAALVVVGANAFRLLRRPAVQVAMPVAAPPAPHRWEEVVQYAAVRVTDSPAPARFGAPIPTVEADAWPAGAPPRAYVAHHLCANSDVMWKRVKDALDAAPGKGPTEALGQLVTGCGVTSCPRALDRARKTGQGRVHHVALYALSQCPGQVVRALLDAPGVPAALVVDWALRTAKDEADAWPRLDDALDDAIAAGDVMQTRMAAIMVGRHNKAAGTALLVRRHATAPAPLQFSIAMGLVESEEPAAKNIARQACATQNPDPMCRPLPTVPEPTAPGVDDVEDSPVVAVDVVKSNPASRDNVVARLKAHVTPGDRLAVEALRALVALDRAAAVAVARALPDTDEALKPYTTALRRMPDTAQAMALLKENCGSTPDAANLVLLVDWLEACGAAYLFDVETDTFPNEHDGLLFTLAALGGGAWGDVLFEEDVPPSEDGAAPYTLHAYGWGKKYVTSAKNLGDWFDVAAVVALLNAMARDRGMTTRWIVLETWGQEAMVAAADEAWLHQAWKDGLLQPAMPGAAQEAGKEFESLVLQKIRDGKLRLDGE